MIKKRKYEVTHVTKRFSVRSETSPTPREKYLASGPVIFVAGSSALTHTQPMILTLFHDRWCLSDREGICFQRLLQSIYKVEILQLPRFSFALTDLHEKKRRPDEDLTLGLSIRTTDNMFGAALLLATHFPRHAHEWLHLINQARSAADRLSSDDLKNRRGSGI